MSLGLLNFLTYRHSSISQTYISTVYKNLFSRTNVIGAIQLQILCRQIRLLIAASPCEYLRKEICVSLLLIFARIYII